MKFKTTVSASQRKWDWAHISLTNPVPPISDGSFTFLIKQLLERRHQDIFIGYHDAAAFAIAEEIELPVIHLDPVAHPLRARRIFRLGQRLFTRTPPARPVMCAIADVLQQTGCRKVMLWGDFDYLPALRQVLPDHTIAFAQRHYYYAPHRGDYSQADYLITQTWGQTRLAYETRQAIYPLVVTIANGAELGVFCPATPAERTALRQAHGISDDSLVVIFPSKLAIYKGTRYLERLIHVTQTRGINVHFLVVGKLHNSLPSNHRQPLEFALSNSPHVTWLKGVPRPEMPNLFRAADVCLMPVTWFEGFSMAAVEALACGLPLLATNYGCFPEIIYDGYNGFLCRRERLLEDALQGIIRLNEDRELLATMSRNARYYAEQRLPRERLLTNFERFLEGRLEDIVYDLSKPEPPALS